MKAGALCSVLGMDTQTTPLQFRNHKGGEYRASHDGVQYRARKSSSGRWWAEERPADGNHPWHPLSEGLALRDDAEAACQERAAMPPETRAKEAALAQLAKVVDIHARAQAAVAETTEMLTETIRNAFDKGVSGGAMVAYTEKAGITTRNRLYQIRDGHR